jgi:hypothetical protein
MGKTTLLVSLLFIAPAILWGCERTIEEDVIKPIEAINKLKNPASLEVAVSNVRIVQAALMRYPVTSSENLYPPDMEIPNYDSLREILPDESLPLDMADLMWDPSYGIVYMSDGYTFTFKIRTVTEERHIITATPSGVVVNR